MTTEPGGAAPATDLAPWHAFPRGPLAGNFLHELLEWLGLSGFEHVNAAGFGEQLAKRCEYAGWEHRQEQVQQWLRAIATTRLPPLECSLAQLSVRVPEMEFWLPSPHLDALRLDQLCRRYLFAGQARPALPARTLHGMLKGYADLVFEHQGRYWIIDYKSNALGADDAAYQPQTLADAMLSHRYDVQGAIYMLALHRLLRSRLGAAYDPARQLGGALFLFLRGIHGPEHGCCVLPAATEMLEQFDALLERGAATDDRGVMA
jgi:exodeoxyribonuclease V beta subunit